MDNQATAPASAAAAWASVVNRATAELQSAEKTLNALINAVDSDQVILAKLQLEVARDSGRCQ